MLWKNPFLIKNSEQYSDTSEFLSIFDSSVLNMISEENLNKVSFISSTPGAGKTSLFKAFSPGILRKVANTKQEEYQDIQKNLKKLGVIENGKPTLLSINISCARGYNIIDSMFSNGRRQQVLFALLNYRMIILFFNSICTLFDLKIPDLEKISFATVPDEIISECNHFINALEAYDWACKGERTLCDYLDDDVDGNNIDLSFVHMSLIALKLLEPNNIIIDNKKELQYTLIIFDDFHKLTNRQQKIVSDSAYLLKSRCGVWFGQRLEGLEPATIISLDGSLERDYNSNVYIDNYWSDNSNKKMFYSLLENIANKRVVSSHYLGLTHFNDCITDELDIDKTGRDRLINYIASIKEMISASIEYSNKYSEFIVFIENNTDPKDLLQKAVFYESIKIHINRSNDGQLKFYLGEVLNLDEMIEFYNKIKDPALFYVCWLCDQPFYFGLDKLKQLSSFNIEQFLFFSAQLFDFVHTKNLKSGSVKVLNAKEQEKCIKASSEKRWFDMDRRYENADQIKSLLSNIAYYGTESKKTERASYAGGAYTGIGIKSKDLEKIKDDSNFEVLKDVLSKCIASRYLEKRVINSEQESITVFYLNRWLCVYFDLPLAYGGWKRCSISNVQKMCHKSINEFNFDQFYMQDF